MYVLLEIFCPLLVWLLRNEVQGIILHNLRKWSNSSSRKTRLNKNKASSRKLIDQKTFFVLESFLEILLGHCCIFVY